MLSALKEGKELDKEIQRISKIFKKKRRKEKKSMIKKIAGKIVFDKKKSALAIQEEMRDGWD